MKIFGFNISRADRADGSTVKRSTSLSPGMDWLTGGSGETGGATMTNAYQQSAWVYRAINVLAEQVANVPFLFSSGDRGRENLITKGPLVDFYNRPHPHLNRFQYWELRVIWLMLRGECFRIPIWENGPSSSFSSSSAGLGECFSSSGVGAGLRSAGRPDSTAQQFNGPTESSPRRRLKAI